MKRGLLILAFLLLALNAFCQSDTIFLRDKVVVCEIKEVGTEDVSFVYVGETLINKIYKSSIQKIIFKSGREERFMQDLNINTINKVEDYDKVTIATSEKEIAGLYKIGDVSAKARGVTEFSNQDRVKNRAYAKLKMMAAMMGANIIYITDQTSRGSNWEHEISAQTNITGVAYATVVPKYEDFIKLLESKNYSSKTFVKKDIKKLHSSMSAYSTDSMSILDFKIESVKKENNSIIVNDIYRVVRFDENGFELYHQDRTNRINFRVCF